MLSLHRYSYEATAATYYSIAQDGIKYPGFTEYPIMYDEGNIGRVPILVFRVEWWLCFQRKLYLSSFWSENHFTHLSKLLDQLFLLAGLGWFEMDFYFKAFKAFLNRKIFRIQKRFWGSDTKWFWWESKLLDNINIGIGIYVHRGGEETCFSWCLQHAYYNLVDYSQLYHFIFEAYVQKLCIINCEVYVSSPEQIDFAADCWKREQFYRHKLYESQKEKREYSFLVQ